MATIGRNKAVVDLPHFKFKGYFCLVSLDVSPSNTDIPVLKINLLCLLASYGSLCN